MTSHPTTARIVVADFDMPFFSIVGLMIKVAVAAIPATAIPAAIWFGVSLAFGAIGVHLNR